VVQRIGSGFAMELPSAVLATPGVPGKPLPAVVQQKMEAAFGVNFSDVRIHVGPQAAAIGALAFTHGSDIHFAPGQYDPSTPRGQQLLGHELTHVVQQRSGRVRNPFPSGTAVVHDHLLEAEADRMGQRIAFSSPLPQPRTPAGAGATIHHPATAAQPAVAQRWVIGAITGAVTTGASYVPTLAVAAGMGYLANTLVERQTGRNIVGHAVYYSSDADVREVMDRALQAGIRPSSTQTYNGYTYSIDRYCRVYKVAGRVSRRGGGRVFGATSPLVKAPRDHSGHIIADSLDGPIAACNFVGMTPYHNNGTGAGPDADTYSRMEAAVRYILDQETKYIPTLGSVPHVRASIVVTLKYPAWNAASRAAKLNFFRPEILDVQVTAYTASGASTHYDNPFLDSSMGPAVHMGLRNIHLNGYFDNRVGGTRYLVGDPGYP
ncbi:MAG TPA: DUF4157 domain-containing protein, partial [Arenibaculum sp.]|nr:DUF4157 domain-containing protein [Arenibaculum sp.]